MTDPQIEAAAEALWQAECMRAASKPRNITWEDAGSKVHETWRFMARAALEAAEAVAWQPIAEAEKDGTEYWVLCGAIQFHAKWDRYDDGDYQWQGWVELYDGSDIPEPTHYRNLPEPPR